VDTRSLAHPTHSSTEERPCACYESLLFIGHLVQEDSEEVEDVEAVPCRRCAVQVPPYAGSGRSLGRLARCSP
jgi:hypothetical protein